MTHIVAFSGGKDSVAMVLHLLESGVPKDRIHLHHHDVDGGGDNLWDWGGTTSYCTAFANALGLQLFFSYREGGIDAEMHRQNSGLKDVYYQPVPGGDYAVLRSKPGYSTRLKFPAITASLMTRWCSSCVKIDVLRRVIPAMYHEGDFLVCTGERREESANRAKYFEREEHICSTKKRRVEAWRPIIDWQEQEVWAIMERWKIQPHPCYELGYSRCSCQICIFGSENIWASNFQLSPEKIYYIQDREEQFGFTLFNSMGIMEKVKRGRSFLKADKVERWASEAMNEFKSPIFVQNWCLPQGAFVGEKAGSV
jgi:3'-phosphoadenosine 5'-phosphosulfate sulfotransferase (PAPS reductase)/FAD synthetase